MDINIIIIYFLETYYIFLLFLDRAIYGIVGFILIIGYSHSTLCSNILNREKLIVIIRFIT